jgi:integrase
MPHHLISDGIASVIKFCTDNRTAETANKYQLACEEIVFSYSYNNITCYSQSFNNELIQTVQAKLERQSPTRFNEDRYLFRTLRMLDDYFEGEPFKDKYPLRSRYKLPLEPFYEEWANDFKSSLNSGRLTIPVLYSIARDFFYYIQSKEISDFCLISQDTVYDFLMYEYPTHTGCMGNVMYVSRLLCDYLRKKGYDNIPTELFPFALPSARKKVLPAFKRSDMERILKKPNTDNSIGKRDYAILILASFTGMRAVDISNIKLTDINWNDKTIHFIQHKTGFGLSLPLVEGAASAIADYLLNGRPATELPYVFLTGVMPFRKLNDKSSVANVLNKYTRLAGVDKTAHDGKSFHAFRRSMGAWLLESGVDPEMISQVLGHHSKEVLKRYLPLGTAMLGICALDIEAIPVKSEVYR